MVGMSDDAVKAELTQKHKPLFLGAGTDGANTKPSEQKGQAEAPDPPAVIDDSGLDEYDPTVESKVIYYLEPRVLARRFLTVVYGVRDSSKSTYAARLAVELSKKGLGVILVSVEENWEDDLLVKLRTMGAEFDYLTVLKGTVTKGEKTELMDLSEDYLAKLGKKVKAKEAVLVIFDTLAALIPSKLDGSSECQIKRMLTRLKLFANDHGVAILSVAHINKDSGQNIRDRMSGSSAFADVPRFVYLMERDPDAPDSDRRFLIPTKANKVKDSEKVAQIFQVVSLDGLKIDKSVLIDDETGAVVTVPDLVFVDESSESVESLLDPEREKKKKGKVKKEAHALQLAYFYTMGALGRGPMSSARFWAKAKALGISKSTLNRARKDLNVESFNKGQAKWVRFSEGPKVPVPVVP